MHQDKHYTFIISFLVVICSAFLYFIVVNTAFADNVLPNVKVKGIDISFYNEESLKKIEKDFQSQFSPTLKVKIDNYEYEVPTSELGLKLDTDYILNYGKGGNILDVIKNGATLIDGEELPLPVDLNIQTVLNYHPVKFNGINTAKIDQGARVTGCEFENYYVPLKLDVLKADVLRALFNNQTLTGSIQNYAVNPEDARIIYYCELYNNDLTKLNKAFKYFINNYNLNISAVFGMYEIDNGVRWQLMNESLLTQVLTEYKPSVDRDPQKSITDWTEDKVIILKESTQGRELNVPKTIESIYAWLSNINYDIPFEFNFTSLTEYYRGREVSNFSKLIGIGKTRIDLIRNGVFNWVVPNAQAGIEEIHNVIVQPGEEFSYIGTVKPRTDNFLVMESGRPLGGGTCNSTTTLFRAILDSGLPITERHSHTFMVGSYAWGAYPMNIVEATYYYQPNVDLKFRNDLNYPILIRSSVYKGGDGYQYHTVSFHTDPKAPDREVELKNWRRYNVRSETQFTGAFDRIVKENGVVIRNETFESRYN